MPFLLPDWDNFSGDCVVPFVPSLSFQGYDDWVSFFPRKSEYDFIQKCILRAEQGERIHICGVSNRESIECISEYYRQK
jgi:dihydroorotase-like cyclic amidohydrolase